MGFPNLPLFAIDVGRGTQDILLYDPATPPENAVKLVLPSPNVIVARQIEQAATAGRDIFLDGQVMGGGANTQAISKAIAAGIRVCVTPKAAPTIKDNPDMVRARGIEIVDTPPEDCVEIRTADYMGAQLKAALSPFGIGVPEQVAIAVQDHGFSPDRSNREFRFLCFEEMLAKGDWDIFALAPDPPHPSMTRMQSVQQQAPGSLVTDTGPVAVIGALCDPVVARHAEEGITIVNIGNGHTLGFTIKGTRVCGMFEHHTGALTKESLARYLKKLQDGTITRQEVFDDHGHGAAVNRPLETTFTVATGPNRARLLPDAYQAAPFGDMMLTGCFGLLNVWSRRRGDL